MTEVTSATTYQVDDYIRASGKLVDDRHLSSVCRILANAGYREIDKLAFGPFYRDNPGMADVIRNFRRQAQPATTQE